VLERGLDDQFRADSSTSELGDEAIAHGTANFGFVVVRKGGEVTVGALRVQLETAARVQRT
jgi:hypothetical protein